MSNIIQLNNAYISVKIDTDYGGKIIEIFNKKNKTNWVWFDEKNKHKFNPSKYSDYDSQWIGGYEELFPNDKVETLNGLDAPDHGELWSSSWKITKKTLTHLSLETTGYFSDALIQKNFELINNKLVVNYDINKIKFKEYLFKLHLALPINNHKVEFEYEYFQKVDINFGNIVNQNQINDFLSSVNANEGKNDFVYFYGVKKEVNIIDSNENICILDYDKETLPYLWIFQSRGGWNNLNVNVLEPCNSGLKDLKAAAEKNMIYIPNNECFKTWYSIEVV